LRRQHLQPVAILAVLLLWSLLSWQRSFIWKDELTLFVQSSLERPGTPRVDENAVAAIFHLPEIRSLFRLDKVTRTLTSIGPVTTEKAELAVRKLTEGLQLFPRDENLLTALGIMHAALRHTNEAVACFELVVQIRTDEARYWNNLAMASNEAGNVTRAQEAIEKGLVLDPGNVNVLRSASRLYWQTGNFPAAIVALKRLQEEEPNNPEHSRWIEEAVQKLATSSRQGRKGLE
jgi:tetratricopeptide (TPR) repeat protein